MRLSLTCPICDEQIIIEISNNQIVSVQIGDRISTSSEEVKLQLYKRGIELG